LKEKVDTPAVREVFAGRRGQQIIEGYRGTTVLSVFAPLKVNGVEWAIISEMDEAEAFHLVRVLQVWIITISLFVIAVVVLVSTFVSNKVAQPITEMANVSKKMAGGDLTVALTVTNDDEIGILAEAVNEQARSLNGIVSRIRQGTHQMSAASSEFLVAAQQQAAGAKEEATQVSETAAAIKELSATSQQVSNNSQEIARSAESSMVLVGEGSHAVEKVVSGMSAINSSVLDTANKIKILGEKSQSITEIIALIEGIANQTNLLSLNAAVEAARAGEAGKGFSVVADAIGKLAEKTSKSTKDISVLIQDIQKETASCVMSMEQTTKETNEGNALALEAGRKLKDVEADYGKVVRSTKEISLSAQQQMSGSSQISKTMSEIDIIVKQTANSVKESVVSAQDISKLAVELEKGVARFTLSTGEKIHEHTPRAE